jgi:hypothetical protein
MSRVQLRYNDITKKYGESLSSEVRQIIGRSTQFLLQARTLMLYSFPECMRMEIVGDKANVSVRMIVKCFVANVFRIVGEPKLEGTFDKVVDRLIDRWNRRYEPGPHFRNLVSKFRCGGKTFVFGLVDRCTKCFSDVAVVKPIFDNLYCRKCALVVDTQLQSDSMTDTSVKSSTYSITDKKLMQLGLKTKMLKGHPTDVSRFNRISDYFKLGNRLNDTMFSAGDMSFKLPKFRGPVHFSVMYSNRLYAYIYKFVVRGWIVSGFVRQNSKPTRKCLIRQKRLKYVSRKCQHKLIEPKNHY